MELSITDNPERKRFEAVVDNQTAFIEYIKTPDKIFLTHTEVPQELSGKGIGKALVKEVLEEVKRLELELVPLCPFVALYIKRNPEWKALVMRGINIE